MVTALEMLHAAQAARAHQAQRAVQVYSPGRPMPVAMRPRRGAPQPVLNREQRRAAGQRGPGVDWSGFNDRARQSPGAQKTREQQFNAEEAAADTTPWYRKGLGMVLGNPIVSNALVPLGVIGMGGRAVTYGVEAAAENLPEWAQGPLSAIVDTERTEADDRSFFEKVIKPDSDYGFGQLLDPDNPAWVNKLGGFLGDVALDPTTYLTAGATRFAGAAARGAKLGEAATAASKGTKFLDDAARLAGKADEFGEVAAVRNALKRQAGEQSALARRLEAEAAEMPLGRRVPIRQGRKGRASFIAELAEENPELLAKYGPEIKRAGERGVNTIRDKELREALGLGDPALRWMGMNIPGTEWAIFRGAQAGGWARQGMNKAPILGETMAKFAPKGLEEPLGTLTRGKGGDVTKAATAVRIQNLMRRGSGAMEGRGNKALTDLFRSPEWRKAGKDGVRRMFAEAELSDAPNTLNKFFAKLTDIYHEVSGRPIDFKLDPNTYVPHMMTPQFKRYLRDKVDKETLHQMGFVEDDLLEGSKYLEKARVLKPSAKGVPTELAIGDQTIELVDGSIGELNEQLSKVFRDFKGKAYMDDPARIGEAYVSSISRQAGRDYALDRMARSGNPLVQEVSGELAGAVAARNAWGRGNPVVDMVRQGYTKGQRLVPAGGRGPKPTSRFDDMLADTLHKEATQAQRDTMMKEGKTFVSDVAADVSATRSRLGETLKGLRTTLKEGLQKKERQAASDIRGINTSLKKLSDDIQALGPLSTENIDEMVGIQQTLNAQKVATKAEIKRIRDRYGKKIPRDLKKIDSGLAENLDILDQRLREVQQQYARSSEALRSEARQRLKTLEEPLVKARKQVEAAEEALGPRPVSQQRVQEAHVHIREGFESEEAYEAAHATWAAALKQMRDEGIPIMRRVDGRLTPETMEEVRRTAATIEPEVPPAVVPEAPAAALSPEDQLREAMARRSEEAAAPVPEPEVVPEVLPPAAVEAAQQEITRNAVRLAQAIDARDAAATAGRDTAPFVADIEEIRASLRQAEKALDRRTKEAAGAAPIAPPVPAVVDRTIKRTPAGDYYTDDGWTIVKEGKQWRVTLDGEDDFGLHDSIRNAKAEVKDLQEAFAIEAGEEVGEEAVEEVAEEAVPEVVEEATRRPVGTIDKRKKLSDGGNTYYVSDGVDDYTIRKTDDGKWTIRTNGREITSAPEYRTLKKAEEGIDAGLHRAAEAPKPAVEAVPEVVEAAARQPEVTVDKAWTQGRDGSPKQEGWQVIIDGEWSQTFRTKREAEVAAETARKAPQEAPTPVGTKKIASAEPKRPTQRITKKWTKKAEHGREISVGPEGWQIESFDASKRQRFDPQTGELVDVEGPSRGTRYVAINMTTEIEARARAAAAAKAKASGNARAAKIENDLSVLVDELRGRSFASEREAKLAVESVIRRQRRKITAAEVLERSMGRAEPPVTSTYENLAGTLPPQVGPPPDVAAANLAAVPPTKPPPMPRQRTHVAAEYEMTPEGQAISASRPVPPPLVDRYKLDYQAWQDELQQAMTAATEKERNAATRRARKLGGEFTQTTGKHHKRYAAEGVIMEDEAWQAKKLANTPEGEAYRKAQENYKKVETDVNRQTEAMVYVKAHDPILEQDVYTRAPTTELGFGRGEERVPVLPKPPEQGNVPTGTREYGYRDPPQARYDMETRNRDREILDSPDTLNYLMPGQRKRYQELLDRTDEINYRIHVADTNQARLDDLDQAAKAAYTAEVKAADEAVLQAKRARIQAVLNEADESAGPGAATRVAEAKRAEQAAVAAQTAVREQWQAADKAWRDGLAMRDEYLKVANEVVAAEQSLMSGRNGKAIADAIIDRDRPGTTHLRDEIRLPKMEESQRHAARRLVNAIRDLDEARDMGMEFMTDVERRNLTGIMVGLDDEKRLIRNSVEGLRDVQKARQTGILPQRSEAEELGNLTRPEGYETARFGENPPPARIPPVRGHEGLPGRAYAESLEVTQPGVRKIWSLSEEGTPQAKAQLSGRVPYEPRTEREAIGELAKEARAIERQEAGTPAAEALRTEEANIAAERAGAMSNAERDTAMRELELEVERDEALSPLGDRIETFKLVDQALNDKQRLVPLREAAETQRKQVIATKVSGKNADLVRTIDELGAVARQNADLLDEDLAITEAKLHAARAEAELLADKDLTTKQVQGAIDGMTRKGNNDLDVMLVTVGKDWRMTYEAGGGKKAVLQEGDLILDRELSVMFKNLYDITKDKVLFGRTLNAFTNLFKTYATLTPGFHIRNALSAIFMNSTDGVPMLTQLQGAQKWREYMKVEDSEKWLKAQPQKIRDAFAAAHGSGAGGRFTETGFAEGSTGGGGWVEWLERAQRNKLTRLSQRAGQRVEGSVRLAMALHSMDIGENVESAIQRINRVHFDYSEVSKMDENMKRLIPFWTFMSRNLPMQVSQMWTKPRVYQQYQDFVRNFGEENEEFTPEYWTKAGAFRASFEVPDIPGMGGAQKLPVYFSPDLGFNRVKSDLKDYEDFLSMKRPGAVLAQANPWLTAPIELATRQDIFTGQRFEEDETVPVGGLNALYKIPAAIFGKTEGGEVDAAFMNAIRAVNPLTDRTTRLAPQLTGNDPEGKKRQLESILRTIVGAPVRTLTPEQQDNEYFRRYYDQLDAAKRQQERLQRQAG